MYTKAECLNCGIILYCDDCGIMKADCLHRKIIRKFITVRAVLNLIMLVKARHLLHLRLLQRRLL
jgi:hypothetical protein